MITNVSFTSMFNPEKTHRRNVEGKLINPESDIENINVHHSQSQGSFGKIGRNPQENSDCLGRLEQEGLLLVSIEELLGRKQVSGTNNKKRNEHIWFQIS